MRRKLSTRIWAGTAAFLLVFLYLFPLVVMAEGVTYEAPKFEAPQYKPELKSPEWHPPLMESPQWEPSDWGKPGGDPLKYKAPNFNAPNAKLEINKPGIQAPDLEAPDVEPAKGDPPKYDSEATKPDPNKPAVKITWYEALKFSAKEIMAGTMGYTASLIKAGEIDMADALKGKYLFLGGLGIKGFDIVFKGTATGLGVDVLDGISGYDNLKFVLQQAPNSRWAQFADKYKFFSNMESPKMPGLFKDLNVGAAGISLIFDSIDTVKNFSEAVNPDLDEATQNEKFVDGVGNVGSALMDTAVIATVIPALQPVAGALFVAGAALWLISRAVKYGDKLSGGAITRGIRSAVSKTVGWVKSIFA